MHRLFVAIRPPASIRSMLAGLMGGVEGARWQDDEQLHITLRFVGEVDRHVAEDVAAALGAVHHRAFEVALSGLGEFDRKGRRDALWAGVSPHDQIGALHRKIDQAMVRIGLPREGRAYLPHVTLARFGRVTGDISGFAAAHGGLATPPFPVTHFALYESHIGHEGARYEMVARYPLDEL